jgi:wyosine [tRNA(Phe)-imidazoG37] synthetase (radical SAM superfamily)
MIPIKPVLYPEKNFVGQYCLSPFIQIEVTVEGHVRLCGCSGWMPTVIGNLFEQSLEDMLSSELATDIRRSIITGSYKYCNEQSCGLIVNGSLNTQDTLPPNVKALMQDPAKFDMPYEISLAGDIVCNLSCPSCRNRVIAADETQRAQQQHLANQLKQNLFGRPSTAPICLNLSNSGEVFASHMLLEFLQSIPVDDFTNLTVKLQTNGLLLPTHWHKLGKLQKRVVSISVSIDAASAETYEVLRRGGTWPKLLTALDTIRNIKQQQPLEFNTRMVVQQRNYQEVLDFYNLSQQYDVDRVEYIRIGNWYWDQLTFQQADVMNPSHAEYELAKTHMQQVIGLPHTWFSGGTLL